MNETRLPRNAKEGLLYGGVICFITVLVMLILNIGTTFNGLGKEALIAIITLIPIIWVIAMLVEMFVVGKISEKLVEKFTLPTDGFNAKILFNILFCVAGMSLIMTIIGGMIGQRSLGLGPILSLPSHLPRNFFVALWCEILLAQPVARLVIKALHKKQLQKQYI